MIERDARAHASLLTALCLVGAAAALGSGCSCADTHTAADATSPPREDGAIDAPLVPDAPPGLDAPGLDAPGVDAPIARPDAAGLCLTHTLSPMHVTSFASLESLDVHAGRSFRIGASYTQSDSCHSRAMTKVEIDPTMHVVDVTVRDWVESGRGCAELAREDTRTITLHLEAGDWTIRDASPGGTATLPITIGPGFRGPCTPGGSGCNQDCDCTGYAVCLSTVGFAGPFTACAEPCESDVDCSSETDHCLSVDDGFDLTCSTSGLGCDDPAHACPDGYACTSGRCTPTFLLGAATRVECTCDAECTPGLSCVTGPGGSRCEARCETAGRWCSTMHFCTEAVHDTAGLAPEDAVCGWAGE